MDWCADNLSVLESVDSILIGSHSYQAFIRSSESEVELVIINKASAFNKLLLRYGTREKSIETEGDLFTFDENTDSENLEDIALAEEYDEFGNLIDDSQTLDFSSFDMSKFEVDMAQFCRSSSIENNRPIVKPHNEH